MNYIKKFLGAKFIGSPPMVTYTFMIWSWIGSFIGIAVVCILHQYGLERIDRVGVIGSFGASAVLIYGAPASPLAQPRNFCLGHTVAALIGVSMRIIFVPDLLWLGGALAVSLTIVAMHLTKSLHPPAGATALIAVLGPETIYHQGYIYVVLPVMVGFSMMLIVALLVDNIRYRFPEYWI